jgi:WD40 repeat protein
VIRAVQTFLRLKLAWRNRLHLEQHDIGVLRGLPRAAGIIIVANQADETDFKVCLELSRRFGRRFLFMTNREAFDAGHGVAGWWLERLGAFSVERGGQNVEAKRFAIDAVKRAREVLVIFPEGAQAPPTPRGVGLAVVYAPGGRTLASAGEDKLIGIQELASGRTLATLAGHEDDELVKLWTAAELPMRPGAVLMGHVGKVWYALYSPDGQTLATGGQDKSVRLWNVASGTAKTVLEGSKFGSYCAAFSPDGKWLVTGGPARESKVWDLATGKDAATLVTAVQRTITRALAFAPDGKILATVNESGAIKYWDTSTWTEAFATPSQPTPIRGVAYFPDGQTLATMAVASLFSGEIAVWDLAGGRPKSSLQGHTALVHDVNFSSDGRTPASAAEDETARLWRALEKIE